jgi:hypothetical protein
LIKGEFIVAYRHGDREQMTLFPQSIEEYVNETAPVRAYDVIVDFLDFDKLGIDLNPDKVGCPEYDPKAMLKLPVCHLHRQAGLWVLIWNSQFQKIRKRNPL